LEFIMSANLKTLLTTAAEMWAVGHPWESIAQEVHRRPKTCQSWPIKYRAAWEPLYREVQQRRFEQTSNECHTFLQSLLRNKDPKVKQKALETWLKFGAKAYGWQGNMVSPALAPLPSVYEAPSEYPDDRWGAQPVSAAPRSNSIVNELAEVMEVSRKEFDKLRAKQGLPKSTEQEFLAEWDKLLDRCDIPALMELDPDGEPLPPQPSASSGSPVVRATILLVVGTILAILGNSMSGNDGPSIMSSRALAASGDQHGGGVFEVPFNGVAERGTDRAVQHAQSPHAADGRDGERAATQVFAASATGFAFGSEALGLGGDGEQVLLVRIANHGDDQAGRSLKRIKQLFARAVKDKVTDANPFDGIRPGGMANVARLQYIPATDIAKVIESARNWEWRVVIALARFAGLRVPSELVALTWADVNLETNRLVVRSPKLEKSSTGGVRVVPILPELLPYLRDAFDAAPEGEKLVVPTLGKALSGNLRTEMRRAIERAGLVPWQRTFQNLRSSFVMTCTNSFRHTLPLAGPATRTRPPSLITWMYWTHISTVQAVKKAVHNPVQ